MLNKSFAKLFIYEYFYQDDLSRNWLTLLEMTTINFRPILNDIASLPEVQKYVVGNLKLAASIDNLAYALDQASIDCFNDPKLGPLLMMGRYAFGKVFPDYRCRLSKPAIVGEQTTKPSAYKACNGF